MLFPNSTNAENCHIPSKVRGLWLQKRKIFAFTKNSNYISFFRTFVYASIIFSNQCHFTTSHVISLILLIHVSSSPNYSIRQLVPTANKLENNCPGCDRRYFILHYCRHRHHSPFLLSTNSNWNSWEMHYPLLWPNIQKQLNIIIQYFQKIPVSIRATSSSGWLKWYFEQLLIDNILFYKQFGVQQSQPPGGESRHSGGQGGRLFTPSGPPAALWWTWRWLA